MSKLHARVVSESTDSHRWMIVDHVWDGISAPIAISPETFVSEADAMAAGEVELIRIKAEPARDHPVVD